MGTKKHFEAPVEQQIELYHQAGFEGFFTEWDDHIPLYRQTADRLGMIYQSIHAPFYHCADMWGTDEKARAATEEFLHCVQVCAEVEVPIMILHAYIGFGPNDGPNPAGIENYRRVVDLAAEKNVKVAFENAEGEAYLAAVMTAFADYENVGFCWDTGHELCYNGGKDMMALYGDRLIATHLNDNLGVSDFGGVITPTDDHHLLPFDGIQDWESVVRRLNRWGYDGILTFELNRTSKGGRHNNDKYLRMPLEEYIAEAYGRACRVAALKCRTPTRAEAVTSTTYASGNIQTIVGGTDV